MSMSFEHFFDVAFFNNFPSSPTLLGFRKSLKQYPISSSVSTREKIKTSVRFDFVAY